jgi:uncharacterized damage-inducible protein DinB
MVIKEACANILHQLRDLVVNIQEDDFKRPVTALGSSTIGQHLRHTLEFFICLEIGFDNGVINYDKRAHDKLIETDKFTALDTITQIEEFISRLSDKQLTLEVSYNLESEEFHTLKTTATRELVYNIEHAVHHMAIIKIGVHEIASYIRLAPDFGIAASTIRYREATAPASH